MPSASSKRPIKIGFLMNTLENGMGGETPRWSHILEMAKTAEDVGFDSLWLGDRLLVDDGDSTVGMWEGISMLGALAAVTSRIEIGALVLRSIYRNPSLVAKIADSLDEISGGRFILGLGAGSDLGENDRFGWPEDHPIARLEEATEITHALLRKGSLDYEGKYYTVHDCVLKPRGPRPQGPPIMLASRGPRTRRLTARYADIWNRYLVYDKDNLAEIEQYQKEMDEACAAEGRDPASLQRTGFLMADLNIGGGDAVMKRMSNYAGSPLSGSPEEIADACRTLAGLGFSELELWLIPNSLAGVEGFAPVLELLDKG